MTVCFSIILDAAGSIDIGLYPDVIFLSLPGFGIGVILAVFHSSGTLPVESDRLRRLERGSAVVQAVCFSMLWHNIMLYRPLRLFFFPVPFLLSVLISWLKQ